MSIIQREYSYNFKIAAIHRARVNIKSLATEARIIRHEEQRCGAVYRSGLRLHRIGRLREESRYANLAIAFLRGRKYRDVEQSTREGREVNPERLIDKLKRFGGDVTGVTSWLK